MQFAAVPQINNRPEADVVIVPFWSRQKKAKPALVLDALASLVNLPIESGDFSGKEGEIFLLPLKKMPEARAILLGLGKEEELSCESLRRAFAAVAKECLKRKYHKLNVLLPNIVELRTITAEECLEAIAEGLLLTNYQWKHPHTSTDVKALIQHVTLVGVIPKLLEAVKTKQSVAESVYFARDLINGNADIITPNYLAEAAEKIAEKFPHVKATILQKDAIEKEKMGLYLAVARGAMHEPAFIVLSYKGHPKSKDHTVVVGKGVTFDTGGLNLKPTGSMETMRCDMSGAAAALATIAAAASLDLKINVTAVVAAAENAIGSRSFKPGDVCVAATGKTVEIGNTDAEGRLTLADAFSYTIQHLKPSRIIDFATLTGAMVIALGEEIAGVFSNNDVLAKQLLESSDRTGELLWRMPLPVSYKELLKSDIADIKNIGSRSGGSITAALFLQEFVGDVPWAHIDIAGTAFSQKEKHYVPKNGVGFGVRLMIDFLQHL